VWDREVLPNKEHKAIYDDLKIKWQKAYEKQLELIDAGVTESMWKAPGL